jgi:hypothetical protein
MDKDSLAARNSAYMLQLLEEIGTLAAEQLQITTRIYDNLSGHNVDGAPDDGQTWKIAMSEINQGIKRLNALREKLDA